MIYTHLYKLSKYWHGFLSYCILIHRDIEQLPWSGPKQLRVGRNAQPLPNAPSNGEQDSFSEDEQKGRSLWLFILPWDKDTIMEHWDGDKNDPDSYVYKDYSYWRYVSNFNINTVADCQQLLVALSSLSSSVEQ